MPRGTPIDREEGNPPPEPDPELAGLCGLLVVIPAGLLFAKITYDFWRMPAVAWWTVALKWGFLTLGAFVTVALAVLGLYMLLGVTRRR